MKRIAICLFVCFYCSALIAQQSSILIKVIGGANKTIHYRPPLEGVWFSMPQEASLDANGELRLINTSKTPGAYMILFKGIYRLFVEPGKQYKLVIDPASKENAITVAAPQPEAALALARLSWEFSQSAGMRLYRSDSVFTNMKRTVVHMMDSCLLPFEQLKEQRKISQPFYAYAQTLIKNYYASVLTIAPLHLARHTVFHKDSAGYDAAKVALMEFQWREILKLSSITDPVSRFTDTYYDYLYFYNSIYLNAFKQQQKGIVLATTYENGDIDYYNKARAFTREPLREYVLATSIQSLLVEARYQSFIPAVFNEFDQQYPRSTYTKYLKEGVETVKRFHAEARKDFTAGQRFVQHYDTITTLNELFSRFKGKTMYIDLWATWCGPCKEQFQYKKDVEPFLKSKGIEVLYISIDRPDAKKKWHDMIKFYNLEGYHVLATEQLRNDIYDVFGKNKSIAIPHYAICKDGKVVLVKARRPQDKEELIKQIESVL